MRKVNVSKVIKFAFTKNISKFAFVFKLNLIEVLFEIKSLFLFMETFDKTFIRE